MDAFMGTILLLPTSFTPRGWLLCDGQEIEIQSNSAMFDMLGTKFGGDGESTFGIPDLRGKEPAPNMAYYIAMEGVWPPRY
jgi:microcystin-dependent protein